MAAGERRAGRVEMGALVRNEVEQMEVEPLS